MAWRWRTSDPPRAWMILCLIGTIRSSFVRRTSRSIRSTMRIPNRPTLSSKHGPMPRRVVPALSPPFAFSSSPSRILWYGITTWARSLIIRFVTGWPRRRRSSSSARTCAGSTTTPFPITFRVRLRRTPEGNRWNLYSSSPTCTVCPAFAPPWKRTTTSARSARKSMIFPFPSSPNWSPTTTVAGIEPCAGRQAPVYVCWRANPKYPESLLASGRGSVKALVLATILVASSGVLYIPAADAAAPRVTITMQATTSGWNFFLDPEHPNPTINVRVGVEVTFEIKWFDSFHNFAIYPRDTPPWEVFPGDPDAIVRSLVVDENVRTASVTITFTEPASFEYYCEIHLTMHGSLNVLGPENEAPVVGFIVGFPVSPVPGQDVSFVASIVDLDLDAVSFNWTVGKLCERILYDEFFCDGGVSDVGRTEAGGGTAFMTYAFY